jgi:hypothetical protein
MSTATMVYTHINPIVLEFCRSPSYVPTCSIYSWWRACLLACHNAGGCPPAAQVPAYGTCRSNPIRSILFNKLHVGYASGARARNRMQQWVELPCLFISLLRCMEIWSGLAADVSASGM